MMTSRERMLAAIKRQVPDRLPVTTHHVMSYFLDTYMDHISTPEFFDYFGLDAYVWTVPYRSQPGYTWLDKHGFPVTDDWRIISEPIPDQKYYTVHWRIVTPKGELTTYMQGNEHTAWLSEPIIKKKSEIDILGEYMPMPAADVEAINQAAGELGERGLVRGHVCGFDVFGQPGCWQDAACLVGIEKLILATFDDPEWVHALLRTLQRRKKAFIRSLDGARYDVIELGGGDASTTVISPQIFRQFVAPYDGELIALAHEYGQRIVYHTCGGMMPILEDIADMGPDAMETFTPPAMGGDVDLAEAKRRIGHRVCMIGGFDQFHHLLGCTEAETRAAVRRCFQAAGEGGGFILSPSDHFFDADVNLIAAFADQARRCIYS
ncbi:MAG: uroporphyrinogen decarboxylase family protein [Chloroflexota bacterium]|nr:uroporphyrinogen decarboxylase family protein [Chloroflexota bacterium]